MKFIKNAIRKTFSFIGYDLRRSRSIRPTVSLDKFEILSENFKNITTSYENHLNDGNDYIPPNKLRPKLLARLLGTPPAEAYFLIESLHKCKEVSGDVCEFGVAQGETSALIANEIALFKKKRLHLFDSFEGLPTPSEKDKLKDDIFSLGSIEAYTGLMSCPEDMVQSRMNAISFPKSRYLIHKGFIEKVIYEDQDLPNEVCFAYVDFDFYEPIKIALYFLHGVTKKGSIIIVDDYDWFSTGAKTAVDEFISNTSIHGKYDCFIPDQRYGYFAILSRK